MFSLAGDHHASRKQQAATRPRRAFESLVSSNRRAPIVAEQKVPSSLK
jgi:hypothetical protein